MGPTRTVPPDPPPTPRARRQLADDPLELDRPPAAPPEPTSPAEARPLHATHLDSAAAQRDLASDLLSPEPPLHTPEIVDSRLQPPEPLGRRTPQPLDAARQGVER